MKKNYRFLLTMLDFNNIDDLQDYVFRKKWDNTILLSTDYPNKILVHFMDHTEDVVKEKIKDMNLIGIVEDVPTAR
jgi:HD superfamily phosphodiesterase